MGRGDNRPYCGNGLYNYDTAGLNSLPQIVFTPTQLDFNVNLWYILCIFRKRTHILLDRRLFTMTLGKKFYSMHMKGEYIATPASWANDDYVVQ